MFSGCKVLFRPFSHSEPCVVLGLYANMKGLVHQHPQAAQLLQKRLGGRFGSLCRTVIYYYDYYYYGSSALSKPPELSSSVTGHVLHFYQK